MDDVLKKNLRRTLILMLISAVSGLLSILSFYRDGPRDLPTFALCVHTAIFGNR